MEITNTFNSGLYATLKRGENFFVTMAGACKWHDDPKITWKLPNVIPDGMTVGYTNNNDIWEYEPMYGAEEDIKRAYRLVNYEHEQLKLVTWAELLIMANKS